MTVFTEKYKDGVECGYYLFSDVLIVVKGKEAKMVVVSVLLFSKDAPVVWKSKKKNKAFDVICREKSLSLTCGVWSAEERDRLVKVFGDVILPFSVRVCHFFIF